jgi:AcrR family transcriptional regulator
VCHDSPVPSSSAGVPRAAGRPRSGSSRHEGASGREEILDAAARLFAQQGYAATSTRQIAEAVGMRQASLYYHFGSKEQVLAELLESTVRPSLAFAQGLDTADPVGALHRLVSFDVGVLLSAPWNVGILYALPEVASAPFAQFRSEREALRGAYRRLVAGASAGAAPVVVADLVLGLVESVISMRRDLGPLPSDTARVVADCAARLVGSGV